MRFLILGPLEVHTESGPVPLGGRKQRLVLAHLVRRPNEVVPTEVLIDDVWGEEPPDAAKSTLQGYVSHLRTAIGDGRLEGRPGGYRLRIDPEESDVLEFESLSADGRGELDMDPENGASILREALAVWRGPAFADLSDERSLQGEIVRLEESRLLVTEDRISAELALGRHSLLLGELEALTIQYPLRERLWGLRLLALYRAGRQADALAAFQDARTTLADELGIDPSRSLQRLHERILAQDPALSVASRRAPIAERPSSAPGELAPGAKFGQYRIRALLGRGGMSVVYLAEHEGLKRNVALKLLAPQLGADERFRERFVRESQLAASLDHSNVIPIYEAGEADGALFIAMRYVDGGDLRQLLRDRERLDPDRTIKILAQVADALDVAHLRGLVHRDVKPGNILIGRAESAEVGEHVYLTDFGLTKRASSLSGITGTGQFIGTLDYAAPEQFTSGQLDARTDMYALGAVLFECLTGEQPFRRETDAALMYAHMSEPPPSLTHVRPEMPDAIDAVIARALAKEPADRFQTGAQLMAGVRAAFADPREATRLRTFVVVNPRDGGAGTKSHADGSPAAPRTRIAAITDEVAAEHGGEVVEPGSDAAVAAFESARQAISAGLRLQEQLLEEGFRPSAAVGVDAGESVPVPGGYRSDARDVASLICSRAGPGQILASETATHLTSAPEGVAFTPKAVRVKGHDEPIRVMLVTPSDEVVPIGAVARLRRQVRARPRVAAIAAVSALTAIALAATALARIGGSEGAGATALSPGVALLDEQTLEPVAQIPVQRPVEGYFADGSFWFLNLEPVSFVRIDADTLGETDAISSPLAEVNSFAVDGDSLWVTDSTLPILVQIDIATGREVERIDLRDSGFPDGGLAGPAIGAGSVWVGLGEELLRIDPDSGEVMSRIPLPFDIDSPYMSYADGLVNVGIGWDRLGLVDAATEETTLSLSLYPRVRFSAGGGGEVWATTSEGDEVFKVSDEGAKVEGISTGQGPRSVALGETTVWVANFDSATLGMIDRTTGDARSLDVGLPIEGVAAGGGLVALAVGGEPAETLVEALPGSVLRLSATEDFTDQLDPALADSPGIWQVERATCAKLLNYPDAPAPEGWQLQPEIAQAMPELSSDDRTYTFTVRDGYTFSPPSDQPVTAETFRYSIERALSPELGAPAIAFPYLSDIVGVDAFRAGRTDHIRGLTAAGSELSITLEAPSGSFLQRLTLPYFCPVPEGTPTLLNGLGARPIPSAGPYYISQNRTNEVMILEQNPNYEAGRSRGYDAIAIRFGLDTESTIGHGAGGDCPANVEGKRLDGVVGFDYDLWECQVYEAGTAGRALLDGTIYVALNTNGDALADPDVRLAAALSIDRYGLSRSSLVAPTDEILPPYLPGAEQDPQATLADPEEARRLLRDRSIQVRIAIPQGCGEPVIELGIPGDALAETLVWPNCWEVTAVVNGLEDAGFRVRVDRVSRQGLAADPGGYDVVLGEAYLLYPDSATFVSQLVSGTQVRQAWLAVPASWFPDDILREADRVLGLEDPERTDAAVALADRLSAESIVIPWGVWARWEVLTDRVGCRVYPPYGYGLDLAAACPAA